MASQKEVFEKAFPKIDRPLLSYGLPYPEACRKHIDLTFNASRVYIICSRTLATSTTALVDLKKALGSMVVGEGIGMGSPTPLHECLEIIHEVRREGADIVVTIGGGSLTDAGKIITFALANDVETKDQLVALPHSMARERTAKESYIPLITIPTTLSGGEYGPYAGITDVETKQKYQFIGGIKGPALVILPSKLTTHTPINTWLASGVRAVDHGVEALCTLQRPEDQGVWEEVEAARIEGLKCLVPSLMKTKMDSGDAGSRQMAQLGAKYSMLSLNYLVPKGASHGIGHALGPSQVPIPIHHDLTLTKSRHVVGIEHGVTSCILMTPTHKYNSKVNSEEQAAVRRVLWSIPEGRSLFEKRGLEDTKADLGDLLDVFVRELGLPRSLKEVGIGTRADLDLIARNALKSPYALTNPIPLNSPDMVMEILDMCKD